MTRSAVGSDLDLDALDLGVRVRDPAVRRVLDDPPARLAFWLPRREHFVDRHGNLVVLDPASEGKTIYPPLLAEGGLEAALQEAARRSTLPLTLEIEDVGRLSEDCEASVYYCCLEALQNVAKHAGDDASAQVGLWHERGVVHFRVGDDGVGFMEHSTARGAGLTNMADRIEAVGGSLAVRSAPGKGTTVELRLRLGVGNRTRSDVVHA